ncbi:hypothetical protein P4276_30580, partial [Bacillus thuringiensis]|nr:hypothetical protein [Bacillus thuringiensis]
VYTADLEDAKTTSVKKNHAEEIKTFKNYEEAKIWIKENIKIKPWENEGLTEGQKDILIRSTKTPAKLILLNSIIEQYRDSASLTDLPKYKNEILPIDQAHKRDMGLSQTVYAYTNLTDWDIGESLIDVMNQRKNSTFYTNGTTVLDENKVNHLKDTFKFGIAKGFLCVSLIQEDTLSHEPVCMRIKIPEGTPTCYWNEDKFIIARDYGINVTNIYIEKNSDGKSFIKVEADLINKTAFELKIKEAENDFNKKFFPTLSNDHKPIVKFDISSFYASRVFSIASDAFEIFKKNIPEKLMLDCLQKMNADHAILFSDQDLANIVKTDTKETLLGRMDGFQKVLYVTCRGQFLKGLAGHQTDLLGTLIHEFGHAIDFLLFHEKTAETAFQKLYLNLFLNALDDKIFKVDDFIKEFQNIKMNDIKKAEIVTDPAEKYLRTIQAKVINIKKIELIAQNLKLDMKTLQNHIKKVQSTAFTKYSTVNAWERFAELFRVMSGVDATLKEKIKQEDPDAVEMIRSLIADSLKG